jgi:ribosomal protein S7
MSFRDMLKVKYYKKVFSMLKVVLIGKLIRRGKKLNAWKIYFLLHYMLKKKTKVSSNLIVLIALLNTLIKIHFIKFRMGSVKKEVPIYLSFERQVKFTITS